MSLARQATRGALWALLTTMATRLISLASLAVLARLLAPVDFGLVAFALVFIAYVETIGDLGTGPALIYWPGERSEAARVTFWTSLAMGLLWLGVAQLLAAPVARFFHNPAAEPILRALAWTFPLAALGNAHDALCRKDLRFRARLVPEAVGGLVRATVAITLALAGQGVWSLVWGQLLGTAARTASLWLVVPWRPGTTFSVRLLAPLLRYGRGIVAVNVIGAVLHHFDLLVVGRRLGAEQLGLYQVASKLPEVTVALLVWVVGRVLFPALARVQHDRERLREAYLGTLRWVAILALPASLGLFHLAEPTLAALFGERWTGAAGVLRGLALYGGLRAIGSPAGDLLKATGRPHLLAGLGVVKAAVLVPALLWAVGFGATRVATTLAAVTAATTLLNLAVSRHILALPARAIGAGLRPAILPSLALAAALAVWVRLTAALPAPAVLAGGVALGFAVYVAVLAATAPDHLRRAAAILRTGPPSGDEHGEEAA